jgi:HK97 family phage major capsid protein
MAEGTALLSEVRELKKALEASASRPAGGKKPSLVLAGDGHSRQGWSQHSQREWPVEQLKALGDAYGAHVASDIYAKKSNGKLRLSGMGPALLKLAAMSGNSDARAMARSQGMADAYDNDNLEKEFGFCPVSKAASVGVSGPRWGLSGAEVRKVALAEGSGQTGGYVIPPQFMNELLTIAAEDGFIEQRAKVIPMNSRTAQWPMLDVTTTQATGTSPYFGGILAQWQPEAATINETEPAFRQSEWVAWDLVLYTVSSNQLLADNGIGLDALLTQLFGQAITWYKEFAFLQGKGAGSTMPLGVLNAPATYVQTATTTLSGGFVYSDAVAMMSRLQIRSWDDACWVAHQSLLPYLLKMVDHTSTAGVADTGARLVWVTPYGDTARGPAAMKMPNAFLNGLPLFFTEKLPAIAASVSGSIILVDWSRYVIGTRLDMQIDVSPHYLFRNNQLAWRVIARCDGKPWLNNVIHDAEGFIVSPFVSFQAHA